MSNYAYCYRRLRAIMASLRGFGRIRGYGRENAATKH